MGGKAPDNPVPILSPEQPVEVVAPEAPRGRIRPSKPRDAAKSEAAPGSAADLQAGTSDAWNTPAMRQYRRFKELHPECMLLFRMGDFYELFGDDAVAASKAIGLTLTQRQNGIPMAGVPFHALDSYLRRLIQQGHRVAVCEQVQDPKEAKGLVDRAVTRVVTPGTLVDESLLDEGAPNHVAAVMFTEAGDDSAAVLAVAELCTGAFTVLHCTSARLQDEISRLGISELLYVQSVGDEAPPRVARLRQVAGCALTPRPAWTFRPRESSELLCSHYGVARLDGFGFAADDAAIPVCGALLHYLLETQAGSDAGTSAEATKRPLAHLNPPRRLTADGFVQLDGSTIRSLEIERTMRNGDPEGSLLSIYARGRTSMGKRLLRQWLLYPLRDIGAIEARQRAVAALVEDREAMDALAAALDMVQDVARIAGRTAMGRATPRDIVALGRSVATVSRLKELLADRPAFAACSRRLEAITDDLVPLGAAILHTCSDQPPAHLREGRLFRDGIDATLDECRLLQRNANEWLAKYQGELITRSGIQSLKVGYNQVFGYYIEITHAHAAKVPADFTRRQTLRNAERYVTPELKEFEQKVLSAESRAIEREQQLFAKLCREASAQLPALREFGSIVAEVDVLWSFASTAIRRGYARPTVTEEPRLEITQGRHPVLDRVLADRFVPNDCVLGGAAPALALITGPNMAGKSTFIRQVALVTLMAHAGSFVPAEQATVGIVDRIFTRIGASDEIHSGQSTFMVEMVETASILHHATERSLVILDEIGRGTSTLDGLSLAWAIAESLERVGCRTLFATHYHELTDLPERHAGITNLHVAVREWADQIVFLHRILPGRTDRSYGIHVARLAGLPEATVKRAAAVLQTLQVQTALTQRPALAPTRAPEQLPLFTEYLPHPVVEELRSVSVDDITPREALELVQRLSDQVKGSS